MEEAAIKSAEDRIGKRHKDSFLMLEETIKIARLSNDKLSQQLFTLNNRTINVAEKIGFLAFEDLEDAVFDEPDVWNVEAIKANHAQAADSKNSQPQVQQCDRRDFLGLGGFSEEFEQMKHQVFLLQQRSDTKYLNMHAVASLGPTATKRSPLAPLKSTGNTGLSEDSNLRAQLQVLSRKYDALVSAKENAEKKYKEDYRKWKYFKSWLLNKWKHGKALRAQLAEENLDFGVDFQANVDGHDDETNFLSSRMHPSPARSIGVGEAMLSRSSPTKLSHTTPEPMGCSAEHSPLRNLELLRHETHLPRAFASWSDSPSAKVRKQKESPPEPSNAPRSKFADGAPSIKTETLNTPEIPPHFTTKGRGRYADAASASDAINALYEIDTSRNNGLAFQFDEVVRGREHRQRLEAGDCDCCKEYYNRVEPLPGRLAPPAWDSVLTANAAASPHRHHGRHLGATEHHKKQISRHRRQWSPPCTPPDYWNIGFPTTQEAADINRRAADMHADKRRRVEKEASTIGGRYIRRQDNE